MTTTSIERNFNGILYRVSVKEEERRLRMVEEEEQAILQEPNVTEVSQEETGPGGAWRRWASNEEAARISLEVTVGPDRGVLLQRWHQEGGEGEGQVVKKAMKAMNCMNQDFSDIDNGGN